MGRPALRRSQYEAPLLRVTRDLLGRHLVRRIGAQLLVARIVEVEAYGGRFDPCAHTHRGLTERCATMFGPAGHLYIYRIYGMHLCANLVAGEDDSATAILLRAAEPIEGIEVMRRHRAEKTSTPRMRERLRSGKADTELLTGPGRLAAALALTPEHDGVDATRTETVWLEAGTRSRSARWTPRIGLGDHPSADWCWRAIDPDSSVASEIPRPEPVLSRPRPSWAGATREGLEHPSWSKRCARGRGGSR